MMENTFTVVNLCTNEYLTSNNLIKPYHFRVLRAYLTVIIDYLFM